jgi:PAS domain S-box-containing protein
MDRIPWIIFLIFLINLIMIAFNFTQRKKVKLRTSELEEAMGWLKLSEERYRLIAENMSDVISVMDLNLRVTYVSPSITLLTGFRVEEAFRQAIEDIIVPDSLLRIRKILESEIATDASGIPDPDRSRIIEHELCRKDKSRVWVESNCRFLRDGNLKPTGMLIITRDITERNRAQRELVEEKDMSELIISMIPGIFFLYRQTGQGFLLKRWNRTGEALLGYSREELMDAPTGFFSSEGRSLARVHEAVSTVLEKGSAEVEVDIRKKDGTELPLFINLRLFHRAEDTYYIGTGMDMTERKQAEKDREKLLAQLAHSQKMEAIGTLAGGIAHDFNNILSGIFAYAQLAINHLKYPEKAGKDIEQVRKGAEKAADLVQQILSFSRNSADKKQVIPVYSVVKEALKLLRATIPSTIEIREEIVSRATVYTSPVRIHQIIMNLCTNAYHAMLETGGTLTVCLKEVGFTEKDRPPEPDIRPGRYLEIEISDTGTGIEPAVLDKIFEPYFTTKGKGKGTGLGLAVVFGIVKEHGGHISVHSKPGQGTTFRVYLPLTGKKEDPSPAGAGQDARISGSENILLVDDEKELLWAEKELLEDLGYAVSAFTNPVESLEAFRLNPGGVDIVITDMTMPGITGLELIKKIRNLKPGQPAILCTGYSDLINREKAISAGIREYLEKPLDIKELARLIRSTLDESKAPA